MKKLLTAAVSVFVLFALALQVSAAQTLQQQQEAYAAMKPALIVLFVILGALALICIFLTAFSLRAKARRGRVPSGILLAASYITVIVVLACTLLCLNQYIQTGNTLTEMSTVPTSDPITPPSSTPEPSTEETTEPVTEPPTAPDPTFDPAYTELSDPARFGMKWEIQAGGSLVSSYQREEPISFGKPEDYFVFPGVATFRGNNFRNSPTYGTAKITSQTITKAWQRSIGSLNGWPGSGWTGQPLVVRWDEATKSIMNLRSEKKNKADLVEVILATLDGYIYFYDLDDGSYTRDPLFVGMNFKGAGALDPRGYPLMYVGAGDNYNGVAPKIYIISLIDGKILYERSGYDSFAMRGWVAFDSSPLVDAETDTLIWPGESGVLYTIKLNTNYNQAAGTISIAPQEVAKTRYSTGKSNAGTYWLGYECSAVIVDHYLYLSENGGMFFCVDLNTMELVWAQDTKDDSNSTPVFEWSADGTTGYLYTAPSLHWTARNSSGPISIYKLDARTGEIIWEKVIDCKTIPDVSGGVQSTPLLGKPGTDIEGLIIYSVARTPGFYDGSLIALDTETGEVVWEKYMDSYTWSSPAALYTDEGKAYVVICDSVGTCKLLNGVTGETLDSVALGSNVEASPVVFENTVVVGTRGGSVYGIKAS